MTPSRFQQWLEELRVPECFVDFKYNRKNASFDIHVIADVNGVSMMYPTRVLLDELNDSRKMQEFMDKFAERAVAGLERAGKKFKFNE